MDLHLPDIAVLKKALAIGQSLVAMNQPTGAALVEAIEIILGDVDEADE